MRYVTKLTVAQYRMLRRLVNGLRADAGRYHSVTMCALERKECIEMGLPNDAVWRPTPFGRRVLQARGHLDLRQRDERDRAIPNTLREWDAKEPMFNLRLPHEIPS